MEITHESATELLKMVAAQRVLYERPNPFDLIACTPEVVLMLRARAAPKATSKLKSDSETVSFSSGGSKPPMSLGLIAQADREAELLVYWAEQLGLSTFGYPAYRVNGTVRGTDRFGSSLLLMDATNFLAYHAKSNSLPDEVIEGPKGMWPLRKQTFNIVPDLGVRFLTKGK
ncbi:hypothetical protein SEA_KEELAN_112 [Gordonia phage Keelan]|nr:hypothetical protein SEA_KEELAN_112 [Gordonia phage Keelan]